VPTHILTPSTDSTGGDISPWIRNPESVTVSASMHCPLKLHEEVEGQVVSGGAHGSTTDTKRIADAIGVASFSGRAFRSVVA
jgi:hypothetical protein